MTLTNPQMLYGTAPAAPADEPYYIKRSVVFDGEDGNQYMHMAPPANGNRRRWTLNAWVKRVRPAGQGGSGENQVTLGVITLPGQCIPGFTTQ